MQPLCSKQIVIFVLNHFIINCNKGRAFIVRRISASVRVKNGLVRDFVEIKAAHDQTMIVSIKIMHICKQKNKYINKHNQNNNKRIIRQQLYSSQKNLTQPARYQ